MDHGSRMQKDCAKLKEARNVEKKARCCSVMLMFRIFYEGLECFRRYVL